MPDGSRLGGEGGGGRAEYALDPARAVLLGIDFQRAFGELEPVPGARAAVDRFIEAARAWRAAGGTVFQVRTYFTADQGPGRLGDFVPGIGEDLAEGAEMAEPYPGVIEDGDLLLRKTRFSAVLGGDLVSHLAELGADTVIVGGLTTPICVQTTVDALQMTGFRVVVVADACAAQPLGPVSAEEAHFNAIERMRYVMARIVTAKTCLEELKSAGHSLAIHG